MNVPRWLNPSTNPALYSAAVGVAFAIWQALQVQAASGPLTWPQVGRVAAGVIFAAVVAWQRGKTTPVADPKDASGNALKSHNGWAAENLALTIERAARRSLDEPQTVRHASQDDVTRAFVAAQLPAGVPQPATWTAPLTDAEVEAIKNRLNAPLAPPAAAPQPEGKP